MSRVWIKMSTTLISKSTKEDSRPNVKSKQRKNMTVFCTPWEDCFWSLYTLKTKKQNSPYDIKYKYGSSDFKGNRSCSFLVLNMCLREGERERAAWTKLCNIQVKRFIIIFGLSQNNCSYDLIKSQKFSFLLTLSNVIWQEENQIA